MTYLQFQFENLDTERRDWLVAMLADTGFTGFEEEEHSLKAFIPETDFSEEAFAGIVEPLGLKSTLTRVEEENWNARWESGFEPVTIPHPETGAPWVRIRAHFHQPDHNWPLDLEVTPKMSFGTGHHATTYLVMQQMGRMDWTGKTVIDFGTGTGVLAILAEKLGATDILAIDYDPWCMENAGENLLTNQSTSIRLQQADSLKGEQAHVDIILANINLNIIRENLADVARLLRPGAPVVFSGLLEADEDIISPEIESYGLKKMDVFHRNGWIAIVANKA